MKHLLLDGCWIGALALLVLGCGGRVVVDGSGAGTGGGAGGGVGPSDPGSVCSAVCDAEKQFDCPKEIGAGDCETGCLEGFAALPGCAMQLAALLDCATNDLLKTGNCQGSPTACISEGNTFAQCAGAAP